SRLLAGSVRLSRRPFSTATEVSAATTTNADAGFMESWKKVDMVIIPATTGQMGVLPGHVPTIAELKPGILSVHEGNDVTKYFLSSGFAFIHANSVADVIAVEAVPVDHIDPSLVQKGLTDFTQKLSSATTELDKAEAQIGVDIHSALNAALSG
ncbi:atp synthase subunit delta', partial [Quercus suber]